MMQQLLRRLVFDVPMLSEYCKIALKVRVSSEQAIRSARPLPLLCIDSPLNICTASCEIMYNLTYCIDKMRHNGNDFYAPGTGNKNSTLCSFN